MARVIDPLVIGKVIWDVLDVFVPKIDMSVTYAGKDIITGCDLKPSIIADPPIIKISGKCNELFTLVMIDPDSPSPCHFNMREFVHWIVVNIPGGGDLTKGEEMVPYLAPKPQVGIHRFVFVLFQQKGPLHSISELSSRANFKTRDYSRVHDLGPPVAAAFFNCRREPHGRNLKVKATR
ncbi:ZCN9 protein [Carex littledalei]|uniref:ZCN9 protein n=1 Tax=Carex littledalei TaxID=544730 RepID=A0A833VLI1_9POAL|nr:ZCN9 protein [Carex littledalei]